MSSLKHVPLKRPTPDIVRFIDVVMGKRSGTKPPLVEYIVDDVVIAPIVRDLLGLSWVDQIVDRESYKARLDAFIAFWYKMGYDFVRLEIGAGFRENTLAAQDPAPGSPKQRHWSDQHHGTITSWEEFEKYPWPDIKNVDFFPLEYISKNLPEGMGFITCHAAGPFEHLSSIMSIEGLCLAVMENPDLVAAIAQKVGETMVAFYKQILELDRLVAIFQGDDMGFRTTTLIGPQHMRQYTLPWHKRLAQITHEKGLPYFLHSCGNLEPIMGDLIEDVKIDAKHSFEDAILPVEVFQERYGSRIGVLGGVDINILAAGTPQDVRKRTRFLMETCGKRGRYAVGSGNSIPSYIPVPNYLAMVDEALDFVA
ncbi:MAG TPA: uroporphyrinogen decarboxylase family protein [Candidatus Hydrogenedentes bacterium]|nr:uroporphyrinogen decarboxylase family protein [Candidatus Hydrogenedentota bacterium]HOL77794.1 uroporphyrinogen decarboxylase family protein [Candidatus Hydrogenedentota bacterium]HPO87093.1 uroporphyrinogen decarboxylase family protein [Candidatus Hydrogenedentota bacterium]